MAQVVTLENYRPPARYDDVPWNRARVEESTLETGGSWSIIDTVDLDPLDDDPTDPALRSFTVEGTDVDLWYRVTFLDASNGLSLPSTPIQNTTATSSAFATADELAARLGLDLTDEERTRAETLLAAASNVIRDETGLTFDLGTTTYTRAGTSDSRIPLPERPVVSVDTVELNGSEITGWYVSGNELVRGSIYVVNGPDPGDYASTSFGWERDTLEITYTHGYATIPGIVKQTALEMCVRVWVNPGSVVQEADGSTEATYAPYAEPPRGLMLTRAELGTLQRKLGMKGRSVTIGGG